MDAHIYQLNDERNRRKVHALFEFPMAFDGLAASQSAAMFFYQYTGAMMAFHVSMMRLAFASVHPEH